MDPGAETWQWGKWRNPNKVCRLVSSNVNFLALICILWLAKMLTSEELSEGSLHYFCNFSINVK